MSRRKKVTYDSRETRTILGLLALISALTLFLSIFVDTSERNFFVEARFLFGQTTIIVAIFLLNLGLYLFEAKLPFTTGLSLSAQGALVIIIPALVTALQPSKADAIIATTAGLSGGRIGYTLAYQLFADTLVFAQYTPLILGLASLVFIPVALSMSVVKLINILEKIGVWALNGLKSLFAYRPSPKDNRDDVEKAAMFGDFNRLRRQEPEAPVAPKEQSAINPQTEMKFSERELGEAGLAQADLMYPNWQLPPVSLLSPYRKTTMSDADRDRNAKIIERTLASFAVEARVEESFVGPTVVQYALSIPMGINVSKIYNLSENLALALGVDGNAVRIENISGTSYLGIEVPRSKSDTVHIRELMESEEMQSEKFHLPVTVGKDIYGHYLIADIQRLPHLLIAGATGSGKSILTNSFIISLLMKKTPDELRMILVDPKKVELSDYNGIPHLLTPVITDMDKVVNALKWAVKEMDKRYNTLASAQVRNIEGYNERLGFAAMPYIVIVIDEMADMMMTANRADAEIAIVRLAQKARAVGIHLILATQRPSVNIITGIIKANIPGRIGMSVASPVDSRVILDSIGAESLQGKGDLLYKPAGEKSQRIQGPWVTQEEVGRVVNFIRSQVDEVEYVTAILEDPRSEAHMTSGGTSEDDLFAEAVRIVVNTRKGSSSYLQRQLKIGFNRAARLLDEMEAAGVVGPGEGGKVRDVLIDDAEAFLAGANN